MLDTVVHRYPREIEAEVARAQLEASGIECAVTPSDDGAEIRVAASDAGTAHALLLDQEGTRMQTTAAVCPSCGGRHVAGQGRIFWILLTALVFALSAVALFVDQPTLILLAASCTILLVAVELALKDWVCLRCGERFR